MGIDKLIVTFGALLILAPAIAMAGGGDFPQEQRALPPQVKIVMPDNDDDERLISSEVLASLIVGVLGLAGVLVTVKTRKN